VRIPLDYYRILGLPILATAEQIKQAHRDRTLQMPRAEFSTNAVAVRKALLNQANELLSDDEKRRDYDARFLASTYEQVVAETAPPPEVPQNSDIEIDEHQLIGALLLLQELGEYESVLRLGRPYLNAGNTAIQDGQLGEAKTALSDVVLAIALACLELGREEWQQGEYDNAAEALETGHDLLMRESLFPAVRAEIQADLFKLRPYRILAMLSNSDEDAPQRRRGLEMLRSMLSDRQGIDGNGIDQSGLGVDDFLRFIQQLRDYMTVDEQQALFEAESRRPSAVASYLAVYALMAKGFARQEPALIRRAKGLLSRLGAHQDVYLEQSICALLLGQPDVAAKSLERSQEYEPLAFIREHSQGASDLLPGLCLYTERWMQEEVFPHFRDLTTQTASLKDYFANPQVQAYLEELPTSEVEPASGQWLGGNAPARPSKPDQNLNGRATNDREPSNLNPAVIGAAAAGGAAALAGTAAMGWRDREGNVVAGPIPAESPRESPKEKRRRIVRQRTGELQPTIPEEALLSDAEDDDTGAGMFAAGKGCFVPLLALFLTGLLGYGIVQALRGANRAGSNAQPSIAAATPTPTPTPSPIAQGIQGDMNPATAKQVLELWLSTKQAVMGSSHQVEKLDAVLTGDKLKIWQEDAMGAKEEKLSIDYVHNVEVTNVEFNPANPNEAIVVANVREQRKYTKDGQLIEDAPPEELALTYQFVRENNIWKIKSW
jgi:curved DNA-binding protein CbpA